MHDCTRTNTPPHLILTHTHTHTHTHTDTDTHTHRHTHTHGHTRGVQQQVAVLFLVGNRSDSLVVLGHVTLGQRSLPRGRRFDAQRR